MTTAASWRFVPGFVWNGGVVVVVVVAVAAFLEESCSIDRVDPPPNPPKVIVENSGGLPIEKSVVGGKASLLVVDLIGSNPNLRMVLLRT